MRRDSDYDRFDGETTCRRREPPDDVVDAAVTERKIEEAGVLRSQTMNDGGPAFPQFRPADANPAFECGLGGMSLREWYAGLAMAAWFTDANQDWNANVYKCASEECFKLADAMIVATGKEQEQEDE
jgi:hypothetical protein